jgi:hypothetical protein
MKCFALIDRFSSVGVASRSSPGGTWKNCWDALLRPELAFSFSLLAKALRPSMIRCELCLDAVVNPMRIPPLDRAHRDSVQQQGEVEVVNGPSPVWTLWPINQQVMARG